MILSLNPPKSVYLLLQNPLLRSSSFFLRHRMKQFLICNSGKPTAIIAAAGSNEVYQPFRPPPVPLPSQLRSLSIEDRLNTLRDRLGLWFEYAPFISSLLQEGFSPSSVEESTGITGAEQNRLAVAVQVRDSLVSSALEPQYVAEFDIGGADPLYELRLLNAPQRVAAARHIVNNRMDAKGAAELARAIKDFPRRRGDDGWSSFSPSPGDCLAFMYFRQSKEYQNSQDMTACLNRALITAESESAKGIILKRLEKAGKREKENEETEDIVKVPVVRLRIGDVAEATSVSVLPVLNSEEGEKGMEGVPKNTVKGEFGVVVAEKEWRKWVVLPMWTPLALISRRAVAVSFADARVLPWKTNRLYKEEAVLVIVDREQKQVKDNEGLFLVSDETDNLVVERGWRLTEMGRKEALGTVILVVRPPKDTDEDQYRDEDWE